jgi:hypothetical protein
MGGNACLRSVEPLGPPSDSLGTGAALGSITGYCPNRMFTAAAIEPTDPGASRRLVRLSSGYELRARLRRYAADGRIAKCGRVVHTDPAIVTEETASGTRRARWTGICLCQRAGCPVCAARKARKLHDQVLRMLGSGGTWQHVIVTVPHKPGETWTEVYERCLTGVRRLSHGTAGRIVGGVVEATVRATETTWSVRSGWHVHCHLLWRLRRSLLPEERRICQREWAAATGAHIEHGLRFGAAFSTLTEESRRIAATYLSKLAFELSGTAKAAHGEHWTLGEVYERAATGEARYVALVQEYQRSTRGKRLYQLDRRASGMRDAAPELPEDTIVASWTTQVDREEFRDLAAAERSGDPVALYLPLEVAALSRGDPWEDVEQAILALVRPTVVSCGHGSHDQGHDPSTSRRDALSGGSRGTPGAPFAEGREGA